MTLLVHIAPANASKAIERNGIAARRITNPWYEHPDIDRVVWAFPVLPSFTLTHSWSREVKRWGRTSLVAVTFRLPDDELVLASHYNEAVVTMTAAEAVGMIRARPDPRGYEIQVGRRILPREIVRVRPILPMGWRYWPDAKNQPLRLCDCPVCMPRGEVKASRYRLRVREGMLAEGMELEEKRPRRRRTVSPSE